MTSAFKRLESDVATLATQMRGVMSTPEYPPSSRRADQQIDRRVRSLGCRWEAVRIGSVTAGPVVLATGTNTFGIYAGGGVSIGYPDVPGFLYLMMQATNGYTFEWNAPHMKVFDPSGSEVADTTDLSSLLVDVPYLVVGQDGADRFVYRSCGPGSILDARIEVAADIASDTSNYHTLTLLRRADGQTNGESVGELSTSERALESLAEVTIYSNESGLPLSDGDKLVLRITSTGSPDALEGCTLWLKVRRKV